MDTIYTHHEPFLSSQRGVACQPVHSSPSACSLLAKVIEYGLKPGVNIMMGPVTLPICGLDVRAGQTVVDQMVGSPQPSA